MMYAVLCYNDEDVVWFWSKEEDASVMARLGAVQEKLSRAGKLGPSHGSIRPPSSCCSKTRIAR